MKSEILKSLWEFRDVVIDVVLSVLCLLWAFRIIITNAHLMLLCPFISTLFIVATYFAISAIRDFWEIKEDNQ